MGARNPRCDGEPEDRRTNRPIRLRQKEWDVLKWAKKAYGIDSPNMVATLAMEGLCENRALLRLVVEKRAHEVSNFSLDILQALLQAAYAFAQEDWGWSAEEYLTIGERLEGQPDYVGFAQIARHRAIYSLCELAELAERRALEAEGDERRDLFLQGLDILHRARHIAKDWERHATQTTQPSPRWRCILVYDNACLQSLVARSLAHAGLVSGKRPLPGNLTKSRSREAFHAALESEWPGLAASWEATRRKKASPEGVNSPEWWADKAMGNLNALVTMSATLPASDALLAFFQQRAEYDPDLVFLRHSQHTCKSFKNWLGNSQIGGSPNRVLLQMLSSLLERHPEPPGE